MFENPGETIKKLAKIVLGIGIAAACLILIITGVQDAFGYGLLIGAAIILGAVLQALFLEAFGDLVLTNKAIMETNRQLVEKLCQDPQETGENIQD